MENKKQILDFITEYEDRFKGEEERTEEIKSFIQKFDGPDLFSRKNFEGHITASAYILNPGRDSVLLLKHKALKIWLQPGGHVDETDASLYEAALREAREETALSVQNLSMAGDFIFDVDSHSIPANNIKNEPPHIHHDISFLFISNKEQINIDEDELTASIWVALSELAKDPGYEHVTRKITTCMRFFSPTT